MFYVLAEFDRIVWCNRVVSVQKFILIDKKTNQQEIQKYEKMNFKNKALYLS